MAEFLTTTGISYRLEEIIKTANERLVIISPFIRVTLRIKDLLEDRDRLKIDIRVVYGKNELHPEENNWLESMTSIRTSFCKNLHAKCYLNEKKSPFFQTGERRFSHRRDNIYTISRAFMDWISPVIRPKSITSRRNNKMETKHRWRPATLPHGGKMLAACSRQAIRFCYRCNLLQCRLGSHCSNCTALSATASQKGSTREACEPEPASPKGDAAGIQTVE